MGIAPIPTRNPKMASTFLCPLEARTGTIGVVVCVPVTFGHGNEYSIPRDEYSIPRDQTLTGGGHMGLGCRNRVL